MSAQLLIYQSVIPVTRNRHAACYAQTGKSYDFGRETNSVPLMAVEFPLAAGGYPIVFAGSQNDVMPAVILGVRDRENLFVAPDSTWDARYVPAFIRRYPFVFSRDGDRFVLCIDEAFSGFNREGRGQRQFDEAGQTTPFIGNVLTFLQEYQTQFLRTQRFCARLVELGLLEPMQARVTLPGETPLSLNGFLAVNREKLKALPEDVLAQLAQSDELELIYLHLQSMRNFEDLRERLGHRLMDEKAAASATIN